jgi:hypothetical protein
MDQTCGDIYEVQKKVDYPSIFCTTFLICQPNSLQVPPNPDNGVSIMNERNHL